MLVLQAYYRAADRIEIEQPSCHLPWWLLAGIGHTESGHAEDGRLYADGTTRGRILGPVLNGGIAGDAIVVDTDHGALDGDLAYDRAVGPMQFIPSTWQTWGADGNADGRKDPSNIFDATLAAGRYLCAHGRSLATSAGIDSAVLSYNDSQPYLANVLAWGHAYRDGASPVPGEVAPVVIDVANVRPPLSSRPPAPSAASARPTVSSTGATPTASISNVGNSAQPNDGPTSGSPTPDPQTSAGSNTPTATPTTPTASTTTTTSSETSTAAVTPDGGAPSTSGPPPVG